MRPFLNRKVSTLIKERALYAATVRTYVFYKKKNSLSFCVICCTPLCTQVQCANSEIPLEHFLSYLNCQLLLSFLRKVQVKFVHRELAMVNQNKIRTILASLRSHTANEGPVRIQYKCLVPIYVFPEMKLLFPKQKCNVLSPSFYTHISVRDFYISRIGLPFCCRKICGPILGLYTINHSQTHECGKLRLRPRNSQKRNT